MDNSRKLTLFPISSLLTLTPLSNSQAVSRRYSSTLRNGHKAAHLFTESAMYRYIEDLVTPKAWFKANIDHILELYGAEYNIQKEDLYLGT